MWNIESRSILKYSKCQLDEWFNSNSSAFSFYLFIFTNKLDLRFVFVILLLLFVCFLIFIGHQNNGKIK